MPRSIHLVLPSVACLAIAFLPAGCAKPQYQISGNITRDGKPLEWKSDEGVLDVKFVPLDRDRDKNVYRAETDRQAGAYTIAGIPPGSYRVSIQQMDPFPTHDLLGFALSMAESTIIQDVTKEGEVIDIDLPRDLPKKGK
jgi:hypothetical protein